MREDMIPIAAGKTIWDELPEANVDVEKLEHLFESRAKDLISKVKLLPSKPLKKIKTILASARFKSVISESF